MCRRAMRARWGGGAHRGTAEERGQHGHTATEDLELRPPREEEGPRGE